MSSQSHLKSESNKKSFTGKIGFDITQKERGRILSNYEGLKRLLEREGCHCEELVDFPLTYDTLNLFDVLIFACPDSSKLRADEIEALLTYITNGGLVLVLNHAGGDQGRRTNLGELTARFGINFNNDQVMDPLSNLGVESYPLIKNLADHPLLQNIPHICCRIGCSLEISDQVTALATTEPSAHPATKAVVALASRGSGFLFVTGSYEMFMDGVKGGIEYPHNAKLIQNLLTWLKNPSKRGLLEASDPKTPSSLSIKSAASEELPTAYAIPVSRSDSSPHPDESMESRKSITELSSKIDLIFTDHIKLKEKMKIIELNLSEFPSETLAALTAELREIAQQLKIHNKKILTLQKEISSLRDQPSPLKQPSPTPSSSSSDELQTPDAQAPFSPGTITTAANVFKEKNCVVSPRIIAERNAYQQIIQMLDNQLKSGILSQDQYTSKRRKFEQRISELE